ncbi:MAG: tyrosine-type recombinase/integrase, partial [Inconstantimicrobium porci]|uniref:tyrosine-type recombinase/integrase n=1 Tax=Inconstantimicrobium porci TaxID=2652291 RepID=UPI002A90EDCF
LKTDNSLRNVPIPPGLYEDLMEYKRIEISRIDGRLFSYRDYEVMNTKLRRLFIKLGYPISMHSLRHTYTTLLIQNGIDLKTVSSLIGDDVAMVMRTYSHVNDEMKEKAAELIKDIF